MESQGAYRKYDVFGLVSIEGVDVLSTLLPDSQTRHDLLAQMGT